MAQWQTHEAKQQFTKLVELAETDGPQVVMRHKDPVAVVMSVEQYRRLFRQANANFARFLKEAPLDGIETGRISAQLSDVG